MRTTLDLPEPLIKKAMDVAHVKTKIKVIVLALEELIRKSTISGCLPNHFWPRHRHLLFLSSFILKIITQKKRKSVLTASTAPLRCARFLLLSLISPLY